MKELLIRALSGTALITLIFSTLALSSFLFILLISLILLIIIFIEMPKLTANKFKLSLIIYPILPFFLIIFMQLLGFKSLNLFLFIMTFTFDSVSYLAGKALGKTKLIPSISPGKTVEGTAGGFISLILVSFIFIKSKNMYAILLNNVLISLIIGAFALAGDLFESKLKRQSNIKDSGNLLPGHGGFLDRFDSILFVVIPVFLLRKHLSKVILNIL